MRFPVSLEDKYRDEMKIKFDALKKSSLIYTESEFTSGGLRIAKIRTHDWYVSSSTIFLHGYKLLTTQPISFSFIVHAGYAIALCGTQLHHSLFSSSAIIVPGCRRGLGKSFFIPSDCIILCLSQFGFGIKL